ncbi:MAG: hypothetical protein IBX67_06665 [Dehalococcoidia bacterium]|nr:hypothetical protein [Dehalococcoidia bacterium]
MKRPPLFLRIKIQEQRALPGCWLPLFLLVPLALALLIVLSPLILVVYIIRRLRRRRKLLPLGLRVALGVLCSPRGVVAACDLLCSTPGLRIDVTNPDERVHISVI